MADNQETPANPMRSGGRTGGNFGKPKMVAEVGNIEQLGSNVYLYNKKHQGEAYIRTTKAIGEYISVNYSREVHLLVTRLQEAVFTEPDQPGSNAGRPLVERYRARLALYHKKKDAYEVDKSRCLELSMGSVATS